MQAAPEGQQVDPEPAEALAHSLSGGALALPSVALLVAVGASFVFSGTEAAITSMGELRIRRMLASGNGPRAWLELWLNEPSQVLTTLLVGNTLANLSAAALATQLTLKVASAYGVDGSLLGWAVAAAVAVLGVLVLVVGEIAPKTMAKLHPEWFLPAMHGAWLFHLLGRWLTASMMWVALNLVRAMGGKPETAGLQITEEQIEDMVRIGSEAGAIDESRGELLQGVFDLKDVTAKKLLTPRKQVVGLPLDATLEEVRAVVQEHEYSRYPVYDKSLDAIAGVFFAKTLLSAEVTANPDGFALRAHLRKALFVPESVKAADLLGEFQKKRMHLAIVVDEHGGTAGILTLEDVLEELVGDIEDEHDEPERHVVEVAAGKWSLDGGADLSAFSEQIGADLPESDAYATVGGFVIDQLGRMAQVGDAVRWQDLAIRVTEADGTRVVRVEVERSELPTASPVARAATTPRGQRSLAETGADG